jgi:HSP20 family molecular chaperone IbpA
MRSFRLINKFNFNDDYDFLHTDNQTVMRISMSGVNPETLNIEIGYFKTIYIKGAYNASKSDAAYVEFQFPEYCDLENTKAEFSGGVLSLIIPDKPKSITKIPVIIK